MDNIKASKSSSTDGASKGGGFMFIDSGVYATVTNSVFANNTAIYRGGSFFLSSGSNLTLENISFFNGSAVVSRGGDIHNDGGILKWNNGVSIGSKGDLYGNGTQCASGGSISILNGNATLANLHFEGQRVAYFGGILYALTSPNVYVENMTSFDTQAIQFSGAFYVVKTI